MTGVALVVDDHPMCRAATAMALKIVNPALDIVEAASVADARALAADAGILTLDLGLPDSRGMTGLTELRGEFPGLPILVISAAANPATAREARRIGATGFLSKSAPIDVMIDALRTVSAGAHWFSDDPDETPTGHDDFARLATLTPAQYRVLEAMEGGRLNKQIAYDLGLSEITIKAHVKAILKKLGVVNRTQAVLMLRGVTQ